jgi:hypothetical protein
VQAPEQHVAERRTEDDQHSDHHALFIGIFALLQIPLTVMVGYSERPA